MSAVVPVNRRRRRVPSTQEGCSRHPARLVNVRNFPTITLVEWCRIMSACNILWGVDKYVGATRRLSFSSILIPGGFSFADLAATDGNIGPILDPRICRKRHWRRAHRDPFRGRTSRGRLGAGDIA